MNEKMNDNIKREEREETEIIIEERKEQGKKEEKEEIGLEELLSQVNNCISQLENPQISLEDSFRYYEEGIRKLKICNDKVAKIEQKMLMINSQG